MSFGGKPGKPVGCLFPMCVCIQGTRGCPHEHYDYRGTPQQRHENLTQFRIVSQARLNDNDFDCVDFYDESFGG
jgi:hypothetical protein